MHKNNQNHRQEDAKNIQTAERIDVQRGDRQSICQWCDTEACTVPGIHNADAERKALKVDYEYGFSSSYSYIQGACCTVKQSVMVGS